MAGTNASEGIVGADVCELGAQLRADVAASREGNDCAPTDHSLTSFAFTFDTGCRSVAVDIARDACAARFDRLDRALLVRRDVCGDGDAYGNVKNAPAPRAYNRDSSSSDEESYAHVLKAGGGRVVESSSSSSSESDIDVEHVYDFNKLPVQDRVRPYRVSRREQRDRRREQSDLPSRESWRNGHHVGISTFSVESSERHDRRSGSSSSRSSSSRGGHDYDDDDHNHDGGDDDDDILGRSDDDDNENDDDDIFPFELSSSDLDTSSVTATKKIFRHSFDTSDLDSSSANSEGSSELRK